MHTIFQTLVYQREKGHDTVLATIIWDDGSAPRGKGSQMLVGKDGLLAGTIGGGAVEGQAIALAQEMLHSGADSRTHEFRLRRDGSAQSTGMVCGGDVTVYFRRIPAADGAWDTLAAEALRRLGARERGWLVQPLDGAMPYLSDNDADKENCFTMPLPIGERAIIFGAGHIARALVPLLCTVGFRPVVFDDRPQFATRERFPQADQVICGDFARIGDYLTVGTEDFVVVMTNGHEYDFQVQVQVLRGETAYVGVIGSRKKTAFVNQRLREAGISEEAIAFVHTPVGTAIKAVTPEELAVSIAGEMILVRATRREASGEVHHGCPMH
mgnify:FL=1